MSEPVAARPPRFRPDAGAPERLALLPLLAMILLVPPEVHGLTLAGGAGLIVLAAGAAWWRGWTRGWAAIAWAVALVFPFVLLAPAPATAVAPVAMFVLAAAAACAATSARDAAKAVATTAVVTATAIAVYALWQRLFGLDSLAARLAADPTLPDQADLLERASAGRAFGTLTTPAALGGLLALVLPIAVGLAFTARGRGRVLWLVAAALQLMGLFATASATAAIALGTALGLSFVVTGANRRPRMRLLLGVGVLAVLAVLAAIVAVRGVEVLDVADPDSPVRLRAGNFRSAAAMVADHPLSGVGPGGFAEFYPAYRSEGDNETRHVHNLPLEFMAETGVVVGGVFTCCFFVGFLLPLWRSRSADTPVWCRGVAIGLAAFAIHNLGDYTAWMPSVLWAASILLGASLSGANDRPVPGTDGRFRVAAIAGLATVILAAFAALGTGMARDARFDARLAAWTGDRAEAERLAVTATRWAPWDADAALFLTRATLGSNESQLPRPRSRLALERAERSVRLVPMRAAARRARARARLLVGDAPGAYADLAEAARLYPLHERYSVERDGIAARLNELAALAADTTAPGEAR